MNCPKCKSLKIAVIDSRDVNDGKRRRRKCLDCGGRWTTYEVSAKRGMATIESAQQVLKRVAFALRALGIAERSLKTAMKQATGIEDDQPVVETEAAVVAAPQEHEAAVA